MNLVQRKEGKGLTHKEYGELLKYIHENHRLGKGKSIKYVDPVFDFRTMDYFSITFRGSFGDGTKEFTIVNDNKEKDLKEWIMEWLEGEN